MDRQNTKLPILEVVPALQAALKKGHVVLAAPPGSGKTTIVPLALLNEDWLQDRKILVLEPRRLAARAAAARMSWLLAEECGQTIGYRIRFDSCVSGQTKIEVLTEGILSRRILTDPDLKDVGLIVFDEFHERSIHADLALALCLDICQLSDLRLLVMSATLDTEPIARLLGGAAVLNCPGQSYPVDIEYLSQQPVEGVQPVLNAIKRLLKERQGDILVFLPGAGEIKTVHRQLLGQIPAGVISVPLYGNLTQQEQNAAIMPDPDGRRRVILATSIAETSLTIEGVANVIDWGWSRRARFNPASGLSCLETVRVSKAAADQRAGRAGRLGPGYCLRLWPAGLQGTLVSFMPPEIISADLANLVLELALWGVSDPAELSWLDPPRAGQYEQARQLLNSLGALRDNKLNDLGRQLAVLPVHPRLGRMLLMAKKIGQAGLACDLAAIISERDMFKGASQAGADLQVRLQTLEGWRQNGRKASSQEGADPAVCRRIDRLASQWLRLISAERAKADHGKIAELLVFAYPDRIAKRREKATGRYQLAQGRGALLSPGDYLAASEYIVVPHLDAGRTEGKIYLAAAANIDELRKSHGALFDDNTEVKWDDDRKLVAARQIERLGELVISEKGLTKVDHLLQKQALVDGIKKTGLDCLPWDKESLQLQARINCLRLWQPAETWPDLSEQALSQDLSWLEPYLDGIHKLSQLQKINLSKILTAILTWKQQKALEELAPARIQVPSGSKILLEYSVEAPPILAVRIQEMYGALATPSVCGGKVMVLLHLLSPARRPIQITADLAGFWRGSYPEVIKEMKGRYPKHHWPENPAKAVATRGTKRKHGQL